MSLLNSSLVTHSVYKYIAGSCRRLDSDSQISIICGHNFRWSPPNEHAVPVEKAQQKLLMTDTFRLCGIAKYFINGTLKTLASQQCCNCKLEISMCISRLKLYWDIQLSNVIWISNRISYKLQFSHKVLYEFVSLPD